jgi:hypothetical protein
MFGWGLLIGGIIVFAGLVYLEMKFDTVKKIADFTAKILYYFGLFDGKK